VQKLLTDERLLVDHMAVESRASLHRGEGVLGAVFEPGRFSDARYNPRGSLSIDDRFTLQYVAEVAEIVGALFHTWQETGNLEQQQIVTLLRQNAPDYDWRIFEAGLSCYFQQEYVCAVHTLVPQFENALRTRAQVAGMNVKKVRDGIPGDMLLNDLVNPDNAEVEALLGTGLFDLIYWYMVNSASPFGYRHKIAHGWISPEECITNQLPAMTIWLTLKVTQ